MELKLTEEEETFARRLYEHSENERSKITPGGAKIPWEAAPEHAKHIYRWLIKEEKGSMESALFRLNAAILATKPKYRIRVEQRN